MLHQIFKKLCELFTTQILYRIGQNTVQGVNSSDTGGDPTTLTIDAWVWTREPVAYAVIAAAAAPYATTVEYVLDIEDGQAVHNVDNQIAQPGLHQLRVTLLNVPQAQIPTIKSTLFDDFGTPFQEQPTVTCVATGLSLGGDFYDIVTDAPIAYTPNDVWCAEEVPEVYAGVVPHRQVLVGASQTFTVSIVPIGLPSIPSTANRAEVQILSGDIRVTVDGSVPGTNTKLQIATNNFDLVDRTEVLGFQAVRDGSGDAVLRVDYYALLGATDLNN